MGGDGDSPPGIRESSEPPAPADRGLLEHVPAAALCAGSQAGEPQPVPSYRGLVEPPEPGKTGICCSGGGIRSAAFNLGALQSLLAAGELPKARYLAAVSGGSYICAAFSMVGKRWGSAGRPSDPDADGYDDSNPGLFERQPPFARNSPEEQYLRNRSSYMAPDGWAKLYLGVRILAGLLFNVVFLALPVFGLAVLAGLLFYAPYVEGLEPGCTGPTCGFHPTEASYVVPLAVLGAGLLVALVPIVRRATTDTLRRFCESWSSRLVVAAGAIAVATLVLPALVDWVQPDANAGEEAAKTGGVGGVGLIGLIAGLVTALRAGTKKVAATAGAVRKWFAKLGARTRIAIVSLAAAVAGPLLVLAIAAGGLTLVFNHYGGSFWDPGWLPWVGIGALLAFAVLYRAIDITSLSLHPFYKRRLCTAYALKRVTPADLGPAREAAAVPQESVDGVAVERDYGRLVTLSATALDEWPALIVCAAANVSDQGATPPGRPVTSFTFSANTVGGPLVGAIDTREYEAKFKPSGGGKGRARDFTLPAAVAMSGAAVSPAMGKAAPRSFAFLLALANIRLGVWLPNPRWAAQLKRKDDRRLKLFDRPRPIYLFREMLGRNSLDARYLYVSDGGHYENLGLVELLRRGCTRIFCLDASGGSVGGELGDAVALARSELGVEIDIDPAPLNPVGEPPTAAQDTVTGTLTFPTGETGTIVYSRNVISPGEPWDVRAHQLEDPRFPHDSTLDQLYTDQKFESYRRLGAEAGEHAVELMALAAPAAGG